MNSGPTRSSIGSSGDSRPSSSSLECSPWWPRCRLSLWLLLSDGFDFAFLKTVGLNNSQGTVLTILEQLPIVLTATVVGAFTGVGVSLALDPAVKLDSFTGNLVPTAVTIEWASIILLGLVLFVALSAAIVIFVLATRSQDIGQTLRVGDE